MPVTYRNRKGVLYTLFAKTDRRGKVRYHFTSQAVEAPVDSLPAGYEIVENVNGMVSLARQRPALVLPGELRALDEALKRHPDAKNYRVQVKAKQVIIHEGISAGFDLLMSMMSPVRPLAVLEKARREMEKLVRFTPVMRFTLVNEGGRVFRAERWAYGTLERDWVDTGRSGPMAELAQELVPLLGTDEFFDLY